MRRILATLTCIGLMAFAAPAFAQSATKIGQHNAWGTYSYEGDGGRVCYVLTVPTDKQPASLNHGDIFFFVSQKPGQNAAYEPQFIAGGATREPLEVGGLRDPRRRRGVGRGDDGILCPGGVLYDPADGAAEPGTGRG